MSCYVMSTRFQAYKNGFFFNSLFLFEGMSTKRPATFSSSAAPGKILPLNVLRSTLAPDKC